MGLIKTIFGGKKKENPQPAPAELQQPVQPTYIPGISVGNGLTGVTNNGPSGVNVGIYGFDRLKQFYDLAQGELAAMLPGLGRITQSDYETGQKFANNLFNKGKNEIDNSLFSNIKNFKQNSYQRGMEASSSFLNGMNSLYNANANALSNLRSEADSQGLKYAWDLANNRMQAADLLGSLNSSYYNQINMDPLNIGKAYAVPQSGLLNQNNAMNLDRVSELYKLKNQNAQNEYNRQKDLQSQVYNVISKFSKLAVK